MTVQELFKSIDENEFLDLYLRNDNDTINLIFNRDITIEEKVKKIEKFKDTILNALHLFRTLEIDKDDKYIVFAIPRFEGDTLADSFLVKKDELLYPEKVDRIEHYAYEFSPHKEILSFDVSEASRFEIDDDVCLAVSIFNEMTFCGISEESHSNRVAEITEDINSAIEDIDNNSENFISSEELFKSLGWEDTRTEEEKQFSFDIACVEGNASSKIYEKYFEMEKYYLTK